MLLTCIFLCLFVSGQVGLTSASMQPPASSAIANGPVTGATTSPQGHPQMRPQVVPNATPPVPPMGSSQRLSAPLSPGAALANGPSSQMQTPPMSNNVQASISHSGSAFTPVTSSHPSQPPQQFSPTPTLPGFPVQGKSNAPQQSPQTQYGQTTSYTGQAQGLPPSGVSPTSAAQVTQSLSALHSSKPKRPVMPMTTGTGYPGQRGSPSPRSTPPPPMGPPGATVSQRSTPPPPSNLPGSTIPQVSHSSPMAGYPAIGQDTQAGARPISSRRRLYPAQVRMN